jgi:hypothetical protein
LEYEALAAAGRRLMTAQRFAEAVAAFDAALRIRCADPALHYLRGEALFLQRRFDEALLSHTTASRLAADIGCDRGAAMSGLVPGDFGWMSHMLSGDFERAWRLADAEREGRRRSGITGAEWPRHMRPVWDGADLAGASVLVRCYHGLGDTLQFIRYVPLLAKRAARVCVEAQPELIGLLRRVPGISELFPLSAQDRAAADFGCNAEIDVTELPHAFRTGLGTIPAGIPYLAADPARSAEAVQRLVRAAHAMRVGVAWAAGAWKPERSVPLKALSAVAAIPGVALVNLQRGPEYRRWRDTRAAPPMLEAFDGDDVGDTAATIAGLDLIVSVDTMVAHLAGALGKPVWLMLHFAADWRWLLDRSDSPWYPTMRLFRQRRPGDWDGVVGDLAAALREEAAAARSGQRRAPQMRAAE